MTKEWAHQTANEIEGMIVITNGVDYKVVSPTVFEVAGYKNNGWTVEV